MALASPRQPPPVQQLTPPSSAHGGRGSWDFAVPLSNQKTSNIDSKPYMSEEIPSTQQYPVSQHLPSQPNGYTRPSRASEPRQPYGFEDESNYTASNIVTEFQRRGTDNTLNGNDTENAPRENFKGQESKSRSRSRNTSRTRNKKKLAVDPKWAEVEKDHSNWIHRDKLKEIETKELEEAGFTVGRASRSNSRSQSAARASRDRKNSAATTESAPAAEERNERRMVSPIPAEEDEAESERVHSQGQWDLRTPEEIGAEEQFDWSTRTHHALRPSTSRIPVAKTSPAPVPSTFVERDAPLPRSRSSSGANWSPDANAIAVNGARVRSGSVSSQVLLDDPTRISGEVLRSPQHTNFSNPTSPITGSPPKAKTPGRGAPNSGARKTSAQRSSSQAKPRTTSVTSPKRPGTSGGSISRPTTSHRPEGEAPWIATMYKPDPRLPPDQQIIPTHAKRMQQEQWESDGRTGSMYGRDFRLLNTDEFDNKRNSQIQPLELDRVSKTPSNEQWPLPSPTKANFDNTPKSPTNDQGGYKLTPTIPQGPQAAPRDERRQSQASAPKPPKATRMPEPPEETKEKKGCCCIVM